MSDDEAAELATIQGHAIEILPSRVQPSHLAPLSVDDVMEQYRTAEQIKAKLLTAAGDWDRIDGTMVPSAAGAQKLIPHFGISFAILSSNEDGDPGVRRKVVDEIIYETTYKGSKKVRTGETRVEPTVLYTVTVRATDRWGRFTDVDSSVTSSEEKHAQSDHKMRSVAQTRGMKRALLRLVGGIDANFRDEDEYKEDVIASARQATPAPAKPRHTAKSLMERAIALGLCVDGATFKGWAMKIAGCGSVATGKITVSQADAINDALESVEGVDSMAAPGEPVQATLEI